MADLDKIIQASKKKVLSSFFKIVENDDKTYSIIEYKGAKKSLARMMREGWIRFESLANEINNSYPIFNIKDFKALDKNTIVKKSNSDLLEEELDSCLKCYKLSQKLYDYVKDVKQLLSFFSIQYIKFDSFSKLSTEFNNLMKRRGSDGTKFASIFLTDVNNIYLELENIRVTNPRLFFETKFYYLMALIK